MEVPTLQKNKKQCTNLSSQYFPCFHFSARMPSRETTALVFGLTRTAVGVIIIYCKYSCQSRLYACWLVCQWCNIAPHTPQNNYFIKTKINFHTLYPVKHGICLTFLIAGNVKCHFLAMSSVTFYHISQVSVGIS